MDKKIKYITEDLFEAFYCNENQPYEVGQAVADALYDALQMLYPANGHAGKNESIYRLRKSWLDHFCDGMNDRINQIQDCN